MAFFRVWIFSICWTRFKKYEHQIILKQVFKTLNNNKTSLEVWLCQKKNLIKYNCEFIWAWSYITYSSVSLIWSRYTNSPARGWISAHLTCSWLSISKTKYGFDPNVVITLINICSSFKKYKENRGLCTYFFFYNPK